MTTATLPTPLRERHAASVLAPRRFDTHQVASMADQLRAALALGAGSVVVDGSDVDFVDHDAVELLTNDVAGAPTVVIERPSLALQITLELLGHAEPAALEAAA